MRRVKCSIISVDCIPNDPVDIRCGGPAFLGFDFFIRQGDEEPMRRFIEETLAFFELPLINIHVTGSEYIPFRNVFTKEKIVEAIKRESKYLKEEAELREKTYHK